MLQICGRCWFVVEIYRLVCCLSVNLWKFYTNLWFSFCVPTLDASTSINMLFCNQWFMFYGILKRFFYSFLGNRLIKMPCSSNSHQSTHQKSLSYQEIRKQHTLFANAENCKQKKWCKYFTFFEQKLVYSNLHVR